MHSQSPLPITTMVRPIAAFDQPVSQRPAPNNGLTQARLIHHTTQSTQARTWGALLLRVDEWRYLAVTHHPDPDALQDPNDYIIRPPGEIHIPEVQQEILKEVVSSQDLAVYRDERSAPVLNFHANLKQQPWIDAHLQRGWKELHVKYLIRMEKLARDLFTGRPKTDDEDLRQWARDNVIELAQQKPVQLRPKLVPVSPNPKTSQGYDIRIDAPTPRRIMERKRNQVVRYGQE